jgi:hypothetical protein
MEQLQEMGVQSIHSIPDDFELTEIQRRAATCVQKGEPWYDAEGLKKELASLTYPLYFADCETLNPAVPRFAGMRPYDHPPFQWSVHVQREPDAGSNITNFSPQTRAIRREFISSLLAVLGESGSVVVYKFESARVSDLASWLPEFSEHIKNIQSRLWDLLPIIRSHVYHSAFAGSYSLKSVLPALVPTMTYEGMTVAEGAGLAWESLIRWTGDQAERERLRKALLDYCGQDTLALVKVLEKLKLEANHFPVP